LAPAVPGVLLFADAPVVGVALFEVLVCGMLESPPRRRNRRYHSLLARYPIKYTRQSLDPLAILGGHEAIVYVTQYP
jgi:hypothetical protein